MRRKMTTNTLFAKGSGVSPLCLRFDDVTLDCKMHDGTHKLLYGHKKSDIGFIHTDINADRVRSKYILNTDNSL